MRADPEHPLYRPVRQVVEYAYGPFAILPAVLADVGGIEDAYVHGSWAARMNGEEGRDPADIDVLVIGSPDRSELHDAAAAAQARLGREVNIRAVSPDRWREATEPFLATVKSRPLVKLDLDRERAGR
ncbi:hypothetical protein [Microbacterium sp. NPDC087665]|uniref:hypothetical protein n=1 Tax=Microbacterium sp. NPDC087665 TaxID=3364194 RepID=UPI003828695A